MRRSEQWMEDAQACLRRGEDADAEIACSEAVRENPGNAVALAGLAGLRERTGHHGEASALYMEAQNRDPDPEHLLSAAASLFRQRDYPACAQQLESLLRREPDCVPALRFLGRCYELMGRPVEARMNMAKANAISPEEPGGVAKPSVVMGKGSLPESTLFEEVGRPATTGPEQRTNKYGLLPLAEAYNLAKDAPLGAKKLPATRPATPMPAPAAVPAPQSLAPKPMEPKPSAPPKPRPFSMGPQDL